MAEPHKFWPRPGLELVWPWPRKFLIGLGLGLGKIYVSLVLALASNVVSSNPSLSIGETFRSHAQFLNLISLEYFYVYLFYDYLRHLHIEQTQNRNGGFFPEPNQNRTVMQNIETTDHCSYQLASFSYRICGKLMANYFNR
jgi:hypothetical protein